MRIELIVVEAQLSPVSVLLAKNFSFFFILLNARLSLLFFLLNVRGDWDYSAPMGKPPKL